MVKGIDIFKKHFANQTNKFVLIGGTACDIAMGKADQVFRSTKDLDIVLIIEALDEEFSTVFWDFIKAGNYKNKEKSTEKTIFYRFYDPENKTYPYMIELFAKRPELLREDKSSKIMHVSITNEITSLSAILLDSEYYNFILAHRILEDDIPIISPEGMIPLKAKAYLDLVERKKTETSIDSKDIKKHKNDVFRMYNLLTLETRVTLPKNISDDMKVFIENMRIDTPDLKNIEVNNTLEFVLNNIKLIYNLKSE